MTGTAGGSGGRERAPGTAAGASATGSGLRRRRRLRWLGGAGLAAAVLLTGAAGLGWTLYAGPAGTVTSDEAAAAELARHAGERPTALVPGARNILLLGSDSRSGADNARYGRDPGTQRSDTAVLLHLSAGRRGATAVFLPRDLMVEVPGCRRPDGSRSAPALAPFDHAFAVGGSACSVRTVEKLTRIRIDHHVVVDFHGFKELVDAVDGVQMCLREPVADRAARLRMPAGRVTLGGEQALGYVRARASLGDGSDTGRMERQQRFLGALVGTVRDDRVLLNPVKLYPVLDAAASALTTDPGLASPRDLYALLRWLHDVPADRMRFLTVPRQPWPRDPDRDQIVWPAADTLFARLRTDRPVTVAGAAGLRPGGRPGPGDPAPGGHPAYRPGDGPSARERAGGPPHGASPAPAFRGSTAAEDPCG